MRTLHILYSFLLFLQTATDLNEHIRQIENEAKIFEIINMFPNDDLVRYFVVILLLLLL